jgi:hypothetical protein
MQGELSISQARHGICLPGRRLPALLNARRHLDELHEHREELISIPACRDASYREANLLTIRRRDRTVRPYSVEESRRYLPKHVQSLELVYGVQAAVQLSKCRPSTLPESQFPYCLKELAAWPRRELRQYHD